MIGRLLQPLKSLDVWLCWATFLVAGISLTVVPTFPAQVKVVLVVLVGAVSISVGHKRLGTWTWQRPGRRGVAFALLTAAFGVCAIAYFASVHSATFLPEYAFSTVASFGQALRQPDVFARVAPFSYLFMLGVASHLGLTDIRPGDP